VLVERKLALTLETLLLGGNLLVALDLDALCQKLLQSSSSADLLHSSLGLEDQTSTESAKSDLNKGSVIQDLGADVGTVDSLLEMGHEKHVTSLVELVVKGVVVDVREHGTGAEDGSGIVLVEVGAEGVEELAGGSADHAAGGDGGVELGGDGLPGALLTGGDNLLGL
jgi:hypothetical protein